MQEKILEVISSAAKKLRIQGKCGKSILQPRIAIALQDAGFRVDMEDTDQLLKPMMPVWRSKDNNEIVPTRSRRKIDIVVYDHSRPIALVETESDLNDLRLNGVSGRNGHYDVYSIARSAQNKYFDSYNSLERMACAAFFHHLCSIKNEYPDAISATNELVSLKSDHASDHNPSGMALILVTGSCRRTDRQILTPRLRSLDAKLVSATPEK